MLQEFSWPWVQSQAAQTANAWNHCAALPLPAAPHFGSLQQNQREKAFDEAVRAVEHDVKRVPVTRPSLTRSDRLAAQRRITASFARFAATALDLEDAAISLITNDFLPAGAALARWARRFDPGLSKSDITQACRNAWTACGLQQLLGERAQITPSILGYSLLYPYTDNYLDRRGVSSQAKLRFSDRLRDRLRGQSLFPLARQERAPWALVELIESQYPRADYPQVYDCLLAIHRAQEQSIAQLHDDASLGGDQILRITCAKGGASVLADACFARGWLTAQESAFSFAWGVLLQLGDDLQDVREDLRRGSVTLFTRTVALGVPLDALVTQLLNFSQRVGAEMEELPCGAQTLKSLMKMSWRSLIVGAVGNAGEFFSPGFLREAESRSPFRFAFLRDRQKRLANRQGLFDAVFDTFLEDACKEDDDGLPPADLLCPATSTMVSA